MNREEMYTELNTLKYRIAELEAQLAEPEWVPFPGEIVEVSEGGTQWAVRKFQHMTGVRYGTYGGALWNLARPLSDPNIIQLRPHTPGDPMPCDSDQQVIVNRKSGIEIGVSRFFDWGTWCDDPKYRIVAWAPLP